jgi:hypothetical protein
VNSCMGWPCGSDVENFPRIQNIVRVQRLLHRAHHGHGTCAGFVQQKAHFVQAHAVLAGAGAFQCQGAGHQLVVQGFGGVAFFGAVRVDEVAEVEVAVAHVPTRK